MFPIKCEGIQVGDPSDGGLYDEDVAGWLLGDGRDSKAWPPSALIWPGAWMLCLAASSSLLSPRGEQMIENPWLAVFEL